MVAQVLGDIIMRKKLPCYGNVAMFLVIFVVLLTLLLLVAFNLAMQKIVSYGEWQNLTTVN